MKALDQIKLSSRMRATSGRPEVVVGVIDGPVDLGHPAFQGAHIRDTQGARHVSCRVADSVACGHGTFIAGILAARRGLPAPAICPRCDLVLRPIFHEERQDALGIPTSDPRELAAAIRETIDAGARVINLSVGLSRASLVVYPELEEVCHHAVRRGVILVVAAGNQGRIGYNPLLAHPWLRDRPTPYRGAWLAPNGIAPNGVDPFAVAFECRFLKGGVVGLDDADPLPDTLEVQS